MRLFRTKAKVFSLTVSKPCTPEYLYKYQALRSSVELTRVLRTLETGKLYASLPDELNDPMEGRGVTIGYGYAGASMVTMSGKTPNRYLCDVMRHRVLCLAGCPTSPQMWAHYADGYTGVCLQFKTSDMECEVHKIEYVTRPDQVFFKQLNTEDSLTAAHKALLCKHADWAYECEYRALFDTGQLSEEFDPMVRVAKPSAIIIGEQCNDTIKQLLKTFADTLSIPVYQSYIADLRYEIKVIPFDGMQTRRGMELDNQIRQECDEAGIPRSDS